MLTHHRDWAVEVQAFSLILDSSVGLMSGHSVCWRLQVPLGTFAGGILALSAEEDNLSPLNSNDRSGTVQASIQNLTTDNMSSSAESQDAKAWKFHGT